MIKSWKTRARLDILKLKRRHCCVGEMGIYALMIGARQTIAHNRPPFYVHIKTKRRRAYITARILLTGYAHKVWRKCYSENCNCT